MKIHSENDLLNRLYINPLMKCHFFLLAQTNLYLITFFFMIILHVHNTEQLLKMFLFKKTSVLVGLGLV